VEESVVAAFHSDEILEELRELWAALGKAAEQGDSQGVVRACALTLMVFAEESDDAVSIGETLAELMREHPHRAIVVRVRRDAPPLLEHRVRAQCWMPFGRRQQICCEWIEIIAAEASLADLAPVLLALRAPDLPMALWCRSARLFESPALPAATLAANKLIVDAAAAGDPPAMLRRLAKAAAAGPPIADLAWTRLTRWREIVAQAFESPASRALLSRIGEVRVFHAGERVPPEACYLAGWVLDALGRDIDVRFEAAAEEGLEFRSTGIQPLHIAGCPRSTDSALLGEELSILGRDPVYDRALQWAARIAGRPRG
jgi:glucose-6-phosphate dehydrogenase assembly protein OpcA